MSGRSFTMDDQLAFARLSGDFGPVHIDALYARRTLYGHPLVHGVHIVLALIEDWIAADMVAFPFHGLSAQVMKPLFPGDAATFAVTSDASSCTLTCLLGRAPLCKVVLSDPGDLPPHEVAAVAPAASWPEIPAAPEPAQMASWSGTILPICDEALALKLFPKLCRSLGPGRLALILGLTRMVGMQCPGRESLLAGFDIALASPPGADAVHCQTTEVHAGLAHVQMRVMGGAMAGTVSSFIRPAIDATIPPIPAAARPRAGEFAGRRALIVGGSRGLGRMTALLLAAGGADIAVTYRVGCVDCAELVAHIRATGGQAQALQFDVADGRGLDAVFRENFSEPPSAAWVPTEVYYFATPQISPSRSGGFDRGLFQRYLAIYVEGFLDLITRLRAASRTPLAVYYPSTAFLDQPNRKFIEYVAAKAAGEEVCRILGAGPGMRVVVERLPRLPTDQTASLLPQDSEEPFAVLLQSCRAMADRLGD